MRVLAAVLMVFAAVIAQAAPPEARLKIPSFPGLEQKATEVVRVTLDSSLLGLAARFLDADNPEDAAVKEIISGLVGVYVQSYTFDTDFAYPTAEIDSLRKQLTAPAWKRIVEVRSTPERKYVDIHLCVDDSRVCGLAIIASEPREFTIVNIVGAVDLEKLHHLEGKFGIPQMDLEEQSPPRKR